MNSEEAYNLFHEGTLALCDIEQQGICVDTDYIRQKKHEITEKINSIEAEFKQSNFFKHWQHTSKTEVNINSTQQLSTFLYKIKKRKIIKETDSGQGAVDEEALRQMNIPELEMLLEMKKLKKLRDNYLDGFMKEQVDGVIHTNFNLHLVVSGRSSSSNPNLQNIPARDEEAMLICRRAILPRKGHQFLEVDFKSIEVCINSCINKDSTLLRYMRDPKSDMHRDMAKQIFMLDEFDKEKHYVLRQAAKNGFVFPEFYGDYYVNCAENIACGWCKLPKGKWERGIGIPLDTDAFTISDHFIAKGINSLRMFENHLKRIERDFWDVRFSEYAMWKDRWYREYSKRGYFDLYTGFRCQGLMDKKQVITYPAQGTAFHCLLWSLIQMHKALKDMDSKIVSQVHDSMIIDVLPSELDKVVSLVWDITTKQLPEHWKWIIVPLNIEFALASVDGSWADKQPYEI